jgi:hypothetical protein
MRKGMQKYWDFVPLDSGGAMGQGTVEYLLMLLMAMMTFFIVVRSGLGPMMTRLQEDLSSRAMQTFFGGGTAGEALHQLRIGK